MKILILAEPRSGSVNLANWFFFNTKFTMFFNPNMQPETEGFIMDRWPENGIIPKGYRDKTEHLLIKLDYFQSKDYLFFTEMVDKVILLYREDEPKQIESWINAKKSNNWVNKWLYSENNFQLDEIEVSFFKELKDSFKKRYLSNPNYLKISHEELYYNDGFQRIVDYIDLPEVKNINFPYGEKYRINDADIKNKNLI